MNDSKIPSVQVKFVKGVVRWPDLPRDDLPEIAFIGRSNVGKSSLLNMLLGRRNLARTSGTPGKTRQFNYYQIGERYYFVDLPGYGYAKTAKTEREKWINFIGRYLSQRESLRLVFHLIDSRHPPTAYDIDVMSFMKGSPVPYVICLTKADKLSGNQRTKNVGTAKQVLAKLGLEVPVILTSAHDSRGREEIWEWITALIV